METMKKKFGKRDLAMINAQIQEKLKDVLPAEVLAVVGEINAMSISFTLLDDGKVKVKANLGMIVDSEVLKKKFLEK